MLLLAALATVAAFAGLMSLRKEPIPTAEPYREPLEIGPPADPQGLPPVQPLRLTAEATLPSAAPTLLPATRALQVDVTGDFPADHGPLGIALRSGTTKALLGWHPLAADRRSVQFPDVSVGPIELLLAEQRSFAAASWLLRVQAELEAGDGPATRELPLALQQVTLVLQGAAREDVRVRLQRVGAPDWVCGRPLSLEASGGDELSLGLLGAGTYDVEWIGAQPAAPVRVMVPGPERVPVTLQPAPPARR